ncbi:hypothetical protein [uncultured Planococcus sp.]|uniref:hypothetical protein n=1 Tax=uncultured Planococcus sp. TaxID=337815 RepID=UPI0026065DB8|nr:hypothetical protein [uncultured Planococcus sp.]
MTNLNSAGNHARITLQPVTDADMLRAATGAMTLGLDRFGRLRLGSAVTNRLGIYKTAGRVYVSVDPVNQVVALRKYDEVESTPRAKLFKVDKRGYISGKWLYAKFALNQDDGPWRFESIGDVDADGRSWQAFKLATRAEQ